MTLRPMLMSDAGKMLEWKNYPETRKFSIVTPHEIKMEDHVKWLEKNINHFQIIEIAGNAVGAMRVQDMEVSIWVDRFYWRNGIANRMLRRVAIDSPGLLAKIVDGNVASLRAFMKAGFFPVDHKDNYYIVQWK